MAAGSRLERPPVSGGAFFRDLVETSLLAAAIGALTGLIAVVVRIAISFVTGLAFRGDFELALRTTEANSPMRSTWGWAVVLVPTVGSLVAYLIVKLLSGDNRIRGSGEIVRSVAIRRGRVSPRKVAGHAAATVASVGTGGSAGREGAMVQLAAATGMIAALLTGASVRRRKLLIAAGGGAAIAATFNTPIAGVIFAMEVILVEWSTRAFVPLVVASAMGTLVATSFLGAQPAFGIPPYETTSRELFLYAVLGALAGLFAIGLTRLSRLSDKLFDVIPGPEVLRHVWGGLLVGIIGLAVPQVFGVGYETVEQVLQGNFVLVGIVLILLAKLFAYTITRGSSGSSGAFSPTFFMGSALGGAFGLLVHDAFPTWTAAPGAYALVGMACMYAAVTRASLTAVVLLYEMTHTFSFVVPVMLAIVVADALARSFGAPSYFRHAQQRELPGDATLNILDIVNVGEIMSTPVETIAADEPIRRVVEKRFTTGHQGYPVVDAERRLVGIVTSTDLRAKVHEADLDKAAREFMSSDLVTVTPTTSAHEALSEMVRHDIGHLPVVEEKDARRLVGFLTRSDLLRVERRLFEEEAETRGALRRWAPRGDG